MSLKNQITDHIATANALLNSPETLAKIETVISAITTAFQSGNKLILCGNGGSFADAQHICAEFISRFLINRDALPAIALGCNSSSLSATGNDYGYADSFSRELSALGNKNDIFIPISTSGKSENILRAIQTAQQKGLQIIGLTGNTNSPMTDLCTCIQIPSKHTPRIQECHILVGHMICEAVEKRVFQTDAVVRVGG